MGMKRVPCTCNDVLWSFLFICLAFALLFAMMEPVPWQLKIAFHFFGFGALLLGLVQFASVLSSQECVSHILIMYLCYKLNTQTVYCTALDRALPVYLASMHASLACCLCRKKILQGCTS